MTVGAISMVVVSLLPLSARAQTGSRPDEWRSYGGDPGHTKYSPLDQITRDNVSELRVAWTWTSVDETLRAENPVIRNGRMFRTYAHEVTPLVVDGVLYTTTNLGQIAAIEPTTGETLWSYDPGLYLEGRPAVHGFLTRGLAYWTDGEEARLFYAGGRTYLVSVDAKTGEPDATFGRNGRVDLKRGLGRTIDPSQYAVSSAPLVAGSTVVVGSAMTEGTGRQEAPPGHVRGYDVRTGEMKWIFHTIPQPGEFGHETWGNESWQHAGGANVWSNMSADPELGYIYLPVGSPVTDYYGGHRPGDNLFANSLVCLDAETGERVWHFQFVHHTVWDYDLPAAPNLLDITVNGRQVKAVAQVSKQGFVYAFDRVTGEPIWPIEEREVPTDTDLEGEQPAPTQPFPTRPLPFEYQGTSADDLVDFTPEIRELAVAAVDGFRLGPLFTPQMTNGTIMRPSVGGGASWSGAAVDPDTGYLYVPSVNAHSTIGLSPPGPGEEQSTLGYLRRSLSAGPVMPRGLPLWKPPYSRMTAIDMNTGDHAWMTPMGTGERIRNHPMLRDLDLPPLGGDWGRTGPLLTKTLLIQALVAGGTNGGPRLVAYDKTTGEELASLDLPSGALGSPMTYMLGRRQYIALTVGGEVPGLIALTLPMNEP